MRTPVDKILVTVENAFNDEIKLSNGLVLYKDVSWSPQDHVTIEGEVIGIPDKISQSDMFKAGIVPEVKVGDKLFFSYMVISDRESVDDPESFFKTGEGVWQNQKGETLTLGMLPEQLTWAVMGKRNIWASNYHSADNQLIEGFVGKRSDVDKWISQFKFTQRDELVYSNCLFDNIWRVDYQYAIAYRRGDELRTIGGYVMIDQVVDEIALSFSDGTELIVPEYMKKAVRKGHGIVTAIGEPKQGARKVSVEVGDHVYFDPRFAEKYVIEGKEVLLVKRHKIYGKFSNIQHPA